MSYLDSEALKPLILIILIAIAIYTFIKKDLGNVATKDLSTAKKMIFGAVIGAVIGFYDGFFGPGTGSFFVLDRKSTRLNSSHSDRSRMPSSA